MASSFNYTISTDITAGAVDTDRLKLDIEQSTITIQVVSISTSGDTLSISFKTDISTAEETALDAVVLAHSGIALERYEHIYTRPEMPEGGKKKSDRGFSFTVTAGQSASADYAVTEDLQIKGGVLHCNNPDIHDSCSMEIVDTAYMWAGVWYPADYQGIPWATAAPNGVSLHHYLKDFPIDPSGTTKVKNEAITTTPLNGLVVRVTYNSKGNTDVKCNVGIVAYTE